MKASAISLLVIALLSSVSAFASDTITCDIRPIHHQGPLSGTFEISFDSARGPREVTIETFNIRITDINGMIETDISATPDFSIVSAYAIGDVTGVSKSMSAFLPADSNTTFLINCRVQPPAPPAPHAP